MRIGLISTVGTLIRNGPVGSIEGVVWALAREFTRLGHKVTTFGAAGSETSGTFVATLPGPYGQNGSPDDWQLCEWINLCRAVERSGDFDILHSHAYLWGAPLDRVSRAAMVHTLHIMPGPDTIRLRLMSPDLRVTAISRFQWQETPELPAAAVIPHGVPKDQFTFAPEPDDYVCYLGRFMPEKGPLLAIRAAGLLGLRIRLAGFRNSYFDNKIEPFLDGSLVEYVGPVSGALRDRLLGGARALLYPIQTPEPFGLVLAEAMMCGTPVAAIGIGAVPEIVDQGVTGHYSRSAEDFEQAVLGALALDRRLVRARAAKRFSVTRMAAAYVEVFERACLEKGDCRD